MNSVTDTAKAIYEAYVAKDRAAAERLIADRFRSPRSADPLNLPASLCLSPFGAF